MWRPLQKRELPDRLELRRVFYQDRLALILERERCLRCQICSRVCPRQAVKFLLRGEAVEVTIDPRLCVLCELCAHFCPTGAISLYFNDQPKTILRRRGLAPFYPAISIDPAQCPAPCPSQPGGEEHWCRQLRTLVANLTTECPKNCRLCLEACPRQVIRLAPDGSQVVPEPELCLRCTQCLTVCRMQAITISPRFIGRLVIDSSRCPPDCQRCIEACPVRLIVREGQRVYLKQPACSLCGACLNVCDYGAIQLHREEVVAVPGTYSQAWEQAVTRLCQR